MDLLIGMIVLAAAVGILWPVVKHLTRSADIEEVEPVEQPVSTTSTYAAKASSSRASRASAFYHMNRSRSQSFIDENRHRLDDGGFGYNDDVLFIMLYLMMEDGLFSDPMYDEVFTYYGDFDESNYDDVSPSMPEMGETEPEPEPIEETPVSMPELEPVFEEETRRDSWSGGLDDSSSSSDWGSNDDSGGFDDD